MLSIFSSNENLVGIDIGLHSIKAVCLKKKGNTLFLKNFGVKKLMPMQSRDDKDSIRDVLSLILKENRINKKNVATIISHSSLDVNHIKVPKMPKEDLREAVKWELKKQVPSFNLEDSVLDYIVVDELNEEGSIQLSIVVFSVKRNAVEEIYNLFKEASLNLKVVDVIPMALMSVFDFNYNWNNKEKYAFIDLGASKTNLTIFKDRKLRFYREIDFGGENLTKALQVGLSVDYNMAEEYKLRYGLLLAEKDGGAEEKKISEIHSILSREIDKLGMEIYRSFDFYQAHFREGPVNSIILSGGTAMLRGIKENFKNSLGVPCSIDNPFIQFRRKKSYHHIDMVDRVSPLFSIAVGLALREDTH